MYMFNERVKYYIECRNNIKDVNFIFCFLFLMSHVHVMLCVVNVSFVYMINFVVPIRNRGCCFKQGTMAAHLLGRGVLGDGLGALRDGVLGQFTRKEEADCCLDLPGGDGGSLVVVSQTRGFSSNAFKDVIHERVHDGHGL